jgi:hypothetical protein
MSEVKSVRAHTVESLAADWGCTPEKIRWLLAERHLRAVRVHKRGFAGLRVMPDEVEQKRALAALEVAPEALERYRTKPPPPPGPQLSALAQQIVDTVRAHPRDGRYIYFVRCATFVRVGQSRRPIQRAEALWWAMPFDLELMKVLVGSLAAEATLHKLLAKYHHRHEWFRQAPDLEAAIRELPSVRKGRSWA